MWPGGNKSKFLPNDLTGNDSASASPRRGSEPPRGEKSFLITEQCQSAVGDQILYSLVDVPQFLEDDDDPQGVPGDVDGDGEVTASDITALYSFLLSGDDGDLVYGDQDGDGEVTSGDITFVYSILLGVE